MSSNLSEQINIGKELERLLIEAGVESFEKLKELGTEQAFIRLNTIHPDACLSKLSAIDGAIQGIRWHQLPKDRKESLKTFFQMTKKNL